MLVKKNVIRNNRNVCTEYGGTFSGSKKMLRGYSSLDCHLLGHF